MAHILVHITTGIIPEKAPICVPIGIEIHFGSLTQKLIPKYVLRRRVGIDRPRPLRLPMRRVAEHVRFDHRHAPSLSRFDESQRVFHKPGGTGLMADLNSSLAASLLKSGAHTFGVVGIE